MRFLEARGPLGGRLARRHESVLGHPKVVSTACPVEATCRNLAGWSAPPPLHRWVPPDPSGHRRSNHRWQCPFNAGKKNQRPDLSVGLHQHIARHRSLPTFPKSIWGQLAGVSQSLFRHDCAHQLVCKVYLDSINDSGWMTVDLEVWVYDLMLNSRISVKSSTSIHPTETCILTIHFPIFPNAQHFIPWLHNNAIQIDLSRCNNRTCIMTYSSRFFLNMAKDEAQYFDRNPRQTDSTD